MKKNRGSWGVVVAVGGAIAITSAYSENYVLAVVVAVLTVALALGVFFKFDRKHS
ncbi:hypothetical protein [Streptomyces albidus (ex Kaewkla and Franco 2022)]|uniref:hypothetical protein n=1 Tax=Streptomyces albidus (ex Kaewkla and Franco 2022) TaxID=722709 RepID=UPI0015EE3B45|nr:hypothetical protein [Streptomyces albidus (ex Kaewkla and Franco 2022)]